MKRLYEALFIFSPREDIYQKDLEKIKSVITDLGIEITKEEDLTVKELAYPIAKQLKGRYHLLYLSSLPPTVQKLRNELKLQETLLRYLIIEISQKDIDFMERKAKMVPRERPSFQREGFQREGFQREGGRYDSTRQTSDVVRDFTKPYTPAEETKTTESPTSNQ